MRLLLFALLWSPLSLTTPVAGVVGTTLSFEGDTTDAPVSSGNPADQNVGGCAGFSGCINDCRSTFYKVVTGGGGAGAEITASTCTSPTYFQQRLFVWQQGGASSACSSFMCTGTSGPGCFGLRACESAGCPLLLLSSPGFFSTHSGTKTATNSSSASRGQQQRVRPRTL
jgi:hypothetical protein